MKVYKERQFCEPILEVLVGLPASGKSTYAERRKKEGWVVCSSDTVRAELYGDENVQGDGGKVFKVLHDRIKENILLGNNVVYDATNLQTKRRRSFLNEMEHYMCKKAAVVFLTPYRTCLENNRNRERKVPDRVIKGMYEGFTPVHYGEGWDDVVFETSMFSSTHILDVAHLMNGFNQENHHHSLSLIDHCNKTGCYIRDRHGDCLLTKVAFIHDYGKLYTKTYDEHGEAHYYGHENVGAYELPFILNSDNLIHLTVDEVLYAQNLVYLHMKPFGAWQQSERAYRKDVNVYGQELIDDVMKLHEADRSAH